MERHRLRRQRKRKDTIGIGSSVKHSYSKKTRIYTVDLPDVMDFDDNAEATIEALCVIRHASRNRIKLGYLNFDSLQKISPTAALVLSAEIDLWSRSCSRTVRAQTNRWNVKIRSLLKEMGLFDLLSLDEPEECIVDKKTTFLRFISGNTSDGQGDEGGLAKKLRVEIERFTGAIQKGLLYKGLTEAMMNVNHHAYPSGGSFQTKYYWMSASYKKDSELLTVMFYDQGVGIPATLPKSRVIEHVLSGIKHFSDGQRIQAALESPRTSTGKEGRGRGLQDMLDFVKGHKWGRFSIVSYQGRCDAEYSKASPLQLEISNRDYDSKLKGTLISWEVKL